MGRGAHGQAGMKGSGQQEPEPPRVLQAPSTCQSSGSPQLPPPRGIPASTQAMHRALPKISKVAPFSSVRCRQHRTHLSFSTKNIFCSLHNNSPALRRREPGSPRVTERQEQTGHRSERHFSRRGAPGPVAALKGHPKTGGAHKGLIWGVSLAVSVFGNEPGL